MHSSDGALLIVLDALERESKRARLCDTAMGERDALKRSVHEVQHDAMFNEWKAKDKERDVSERDALLRERDSHIADLRKAHELMMLQLRELEELRRLRPILERQVFDKAKEAQMLQERIASQAAQLTAHFAAKWGAAREAALGELEVCAKRLLALVPTAAEQTLEACETIDAMRLVVAKQLI